MGLQVWNKGRESVGSGHWHEWKTQAKPYPGQWLRTLLLTPRVAPHCPGSNLNVQVLPLAGSAPMVGCGTL